MTGVQTCALPICQNPRTNGKSKAIQTESHKEAYTYTLTKRERQTDRQTHTQRDRETERQRERETERERNREREKQRNREREKQRERETERERNRECVREHSLHHAQERKSIQTRPGQKVVLDV